jgi:hypothetical protein
VDLEAVEVAYNQQRRVFQVLAVLQKLAIGLFEIFVLALVFPAKILV